MESKKINQLATNVNPQLTDLTTIGDPINGQLKKITWLQVAHLIGAQASVDLQQATDNGNTTTNPITTAGLTLTNLSTGVPRLTNGEFVGTYGYGLPNGVASLDSAGKLPTSQLTISAMEYKGTWNASTNNPTLADGTGNTGDIYVVNVAGTQNLGSGNINFAIGDWVIYNGTIWEKSINSNAVTSVFGRTGAVVAQEGDYNIDQLGDVAISSAATNDYLRYNGSGWVNTPFPSFVSSDKLILQVRNTSGATINKGTVVYINGASAGYPTIAKAQANADNTSAQTLGLVQDNISNNSNGIVVIVGQITGIDTSAYPAGTQLYLSGTTAGAFTSTKTLAPTHLVYVGIVTTQNAVNGVIEVKIQNGYELDEIHDVAISSVANNDGLFYESATSLWKNKSISTILGGTPVTGSGTINQLAYFSATGSTITSSGNFYINNSTGYLFAPYIYATNELVIAGTSGDNNKIYLSGTDFTIRSTFDALRLQGGINDSNKRQVNIYNGNTIALNFDITGISTFYKSLFGNQHIYFGNSSGSDYYIRTLNVASSARRGLNLSNGTTNDLKVYAGGNTTLGAWTEGDNTLVIGTGYQGGGGSSETILFHSTGIGNMLALSAANSRIYTYLPITSTSNITSTAFIPTGSSVPANGMYLSASNTLNFATNSANRLSISSVGVVTSVNTTGLTYAANSTAGFFIGDINSASGSSLFVKTGSLSTSFASGFGVDGTYSGGLSTINLRAIGTQTTGGYASQMNIILDNNGTTRVHASFNSDRTTTFNGTIDAVYPLGLAAQGQAHQLRWNGIAGFSVYLQSSTGFPFIYYRMPNGRLGIGIDNPNYPLDVTLPSGSNGRVIALSRSAGSYTWAFGVTSNSYFGLYNNGGNVRVAVDDTGFVYMPALTTGSGIDDLGWWGTSSGSYDYNGMLMRISSSAKYKKNIRDLEIDTTKIYDLRPISFENNENTACDGLTSFGLLAEQVAEIIPQLATYNANNEPEGVQYKMLAVLILNELKKIKQQLNS